MSTRRLITINWDEPNKGPFSFSHFPSREPLRLLKITPRMQSHITRSAVRLHLHPQPWLLINLDFIVLGICLHFLPLLDAHLAYSRWANRLPLKNTSTNLRLRGPTTAINLARTYVQELRMQLIISWKEYRTLSLVRTYLERRINPKLKVEFMFSISHSLSKILTFRKPFITRASQTVRKCRREMLPLSIAFDRPFII